MYVCVCHTGTAHAGGSLVHEEIRAAAKLELRHRGAENGRQVVYMYLHVYDMEQAHEDVCYRDKPTFSVLYARTVCSWAALLTVLFAGVVNYNTGHVLHNCIRSLLGLIRSLLGLLIQAPRRRLSYALAPAGHGPRSWGAGRRSQRA